LKKKWVDNEKKWAEKEKQMNNQLEIIKKKKWIIKSKFPLKIKRNAMNIRVIKTKFYFN
jgi:hypothetical protein